jgi:hypothetical protein
MKTIRSLLFRALVILPGAVFAQSGDDFVNFVRQVQLPSNVVWDVSVAPTGEQLSPLPIDPGGARFELWTIKNDPLTVYLLDTKYVGTYVPMAGVTILTEDPYDVVPRTRADRPFIVDIPTSGLRHEEDAPVASKSVRLMRHTLSYGSGYGDGVDPSQAMLRNMVTLTQNAVHRLSYAVTGLPGADRSKVRGEERFSVFSIEDYQAPSSQLAAMLVQIWPVADASISGLTNGQSLRFNLPQLTFTLNDLYPDSRTYAQVYQGAPRLGEQGTVVPGSAIVVYEPVPQNRVLVVDDWDAVLTADGQWTMEVITATPFGLDRLAHVTFHVNRTVRVNSSITTIE